MASLPIYPICVVTELPSLTKSTEEVVFVRDIPAAYIRCVRLIRAPCNVLPAHGLDLYCNRVSIPY